jgi:hypothetical protein
VAWSVLKDFASRIVAWLFAVDWYSFFHDFAAPGATVIAAVVAACFARQQARTAKRQAEIAEGLAKTAKRQAEIAEGLANATKRLPETPASLSNMLQMLSRPMPASETGLSIGDRLSLC